MAKISVSRLAKMKQEQEKMMLVLRLFLIKLAFKFY